MVRPPAIRMDMAGAFGPVGVAGGDRKSTRLNSSHVAISYAVFCLKKKNMTQVYLSHCFHAAKDCPPAIAESENVYLYRLARDLPALRAVKVRDQPAPPPSHATNA